MLGDGDLENIFCNGDFDTCAEFTLSDGSTLCVNGWFTDSTQQVGLSPGEVEAVDAMFDCPASAITGVVRGNAITIEGAAYTIERLEDHGIGLKTLYLKT